MEKCRKTERMNEKYLTNPILKRVLFFGISTNCFILSIGIQWSQRIYWTTFLTHSLDSLCIELFLACSLFLLFSIFLIVWCCFWSGTFIFTWPSPFSREKETERIHDSQNTYPIKFRLSAGCRCHSFNCMEMAGRMDSWGNLTIFAVHFNCNESDEI